MKLKIHCDGHDPPNLIGTKCNDLTVKRKTTERQGGHVIYECECICGRKCRVRATRIINKSQKSCGKCQRGAGTLPTIIPFNKD